MLESECCHVKPAPRRVLFLDFAGVVNHANSYYIITDIDPECVRRVVRIATETDAEIVFSTPMRDKVFGCDAVLKVYAGMFAAMGAKVSGYLPEPFPSNKEHVEGDFGVFYPDTVGAIRLWLKGHVGEVCAFCILSGIDFFGCLSNAFPLNFVGTLDAETGYTGLTDEQVAQAIGILRRGEEESEDSDSQSDDDE